MNRTSPFSKVEIANGDKILVFGYGNLGRQDDGLGIAFAETIGTGSFQKIIDIESNYQLNIEDSLLISTYDVVIFADASKELKNDTYEIKELTPSEQFGFSSHFMSPSVVLSMCQNLYKKFPRCYLLTIPGYEWNLKEGLTEKAAQNLQKSINDFSERFENLNA